MSAFRIRLLFLSLLVLSSSLWGETELEKAAQLIKDRKFQEAQVLLERTVHTDPRNAEAWYLMGKLQKITRNLPKALDCADKAIQIDPSKANYHVLRGNTLGDLANQANMIRAMGLAKDGRAALERAVQLEPRNRAAIFALFSWYLNVPALGGGSVDKAKALAEQTQGADPSRGHYMKGQILQKQKNPGAAQAEYRLAVNADPQYSEAYNGLGYVELEMKQVDLAMAHFRKQVELDPDKANSYDSLGDGLLAKGRPDEAIHAYRKALSLDPLFFSSMTGLGKALEQAGRRDEAIQHYRQCAQLGVQKNLPQLINASKERLKALGAKE
jgi:tetratricopeptide (TPR) repeat protein